MELVCTFKLLPHGSLQCFQLVTQIGGICLDIFYNNSIHRTMYSNYKYLAALQLESALARSRLAAEEAATELITGEQLRRAKIELAAHREAKESALRRSRMEARAADESGGLRRSRLEAETGAEVAEAEEMLRRVRAEAEALLAEANRRAQIRRQQLEMEITTELNGIKAENQRIIRMAEEKAEHAKAVAAQRKALLQSQLLNQQAAFSQVIRRRRIEAQLAAQRPVQYQLPLQPQPCLQPTTTKPANPQQIKRTKILQQLQAQREIQHNRLITSCLGKQYGGVEEGSLLGELAAKENCREGQLRRQRVQRELEQAELRRMFRS